MPGPKFIIQYPRTAEPILGRIQDYESTWHQPYRDPQPNFLARVRAIAGVALIASGVFAPVVLDATQEPGKTYESQWHQPWSDPTTNFASRASAAAYNVRLATSTFTYGRPPLVSGPEAWWQNFSVPNVLYKRRSAELPHIAFVSPVAECVFQDFVFQANVFQVCVPSVASWYIPLSEPRTLQKPRASDFPAIAHSPFNEDFAVESKWHYPWSEPVRVKPRATEFQTYVSGWPATEEPGAYESSVHQPWSEPVRIKPRSTEFPAYVSGWDSTLEPDPKVEATWHFPWSEPVRFRVFGAHQQFAANPFSFTAETITVDKWFEPWPDFAKAKISLPVQSQQAIAAVPFVEDKTFEAKWHAAWSEPVRLKPSFRVGTEPYQAHAPFNEDFGIATKWYEPWSEPVRIKPSFRVGTEPYLAHVPFNEDFSIATKWFEPWSEPVRVKPSFRVGTEPYLEWIFFTEPPGLDKWFAPWREPPPPKPSLRASSQQALAHVPFVEDTTLEAKWHQGWSIPQVLAKIGLRAGLQQVLALVEAAPFQETVTEDRWHQPWSVPVVLKFYLNTSQQQALIHIPFNEDFRIEAKWHQPWSIPPVLGRPFKTNLQMTIAQSESATFRGGPYAIAYIVV